MDDKTTISTNPWSQRMTAVVAKQRTKRRDRHDTTKQQLEAAIADSSQAVVSANTTLTLFPDTVTLDQTTLTVTKRQFVGVAEVTSLRWSDIISVRASVGPLFGELSVMIIAPNSRPYRVGRFWREDVLRLKRVAQGFLIAHQRKINLDALSAPELTKMLDELGSDEHLGG